MEIKNKQYKDQMRHILSLPTVSIVTGGRAGSDFLQSIYDSHPEVLTFNGWFQFHELFWDDSVCNKVENINLYDLIDEFIGKLIYKLKSRYDLQEKKDKLGVNNDEFIDIDICQFRKHFIGLMQGCNINSKNVLTAITASYSLCIGQDLTSKKIVLHHPHLSGFLESHIKDFPNTKLIYMVRDPRANIVSGYENYSKYYPDQATSGLLNAYLRSVLAEDIRLIRATKLGYRIIRVEDLDKKHVYLGICEWLGVSYNETMTVSTWAGLLWHGDRLTQNKVNGLSRDVLKNNWQKKLSGSDKYVISHLTYNMRMHYHYDEENIKTNYFIVFFLCFAPLSYEVDLIFGYMSRNKQVKGIPKMLYNLYCYFERVNFFLKLFFNPVVFDVCDVVIRDKE